MLNNVRGMQKNEAVCKNSDQLVINKCNYYQFGGAALLFCMDFLYLLTVAKWAYSS